MTRKTWTRLINLSVRLRQPALTAALLRRRMKRIDPGAKSKPANLPAILVMRKIGFEEDILSAFANAENLAIWGISHRMIKPVAMAFFPPDTDDNNYAREGAEFQRRRDRCYAYWKKVWPRLTRRLPIRAVMSGNHAYWAEQELARAVEELGTRFIALHKESFKSRGFYDFCRRVTEVGRTAFNGRKILVYCEDEKNVQLEAGVASADRFEVTGMPRLDPVHAARRASASAPPVNERPTVLFFAFTKNAGLPSRLDMTPRLYDRLSEDDRGLLKLGWEKLAPIFHQTIVEFARKNPEMKVVVKMKKGDWPRLRGWFEKEGEELPANLQLVPTGELAALLAEADVVCGLASTALVEAVAADRPIVVPHFEEAALAEYQPYIPDYGGAAERVDSVEEMTRRLVELARERRKPRLELPEDRRLYLQKHLGNPDGRSGERVRQAVLREIEAS